METLGAQQLVVFVVGAGTMGAGIAEVAAHAGHRVWLFDSSGVALEEGQRRIVSGIAKRASRGQLSADAASVAIGRVQTTRELGAAAGAGLVVEAISEDLTAKRDTFRALEAVVDDACVLASNTSSLSITALSVGLRRPERLLGMHFFNPVPQMQLVEVVSGLHTSPETARRVFALAERWGKVPIAVRSTPGFVVNRVARPFYGEALALLRHGVAEPDVLDACVRGAGFRMGPCELMDLIGHDVNLAVTEAMFAAMCGDRRFEPSPVQRELVAGGWLGRKSGRGFFTYRDGARVRPAPADIARGSDSALPPAGEVVLHGTGPFVARCAELLASAGRSFAHDPDSVWTGLRADGRELRMTDGRPAALVAACEGVADAAVFDLVIEPPFGAASGPEPVARPALAWCAARAASEEWQHLAPQWLAAAGWAPQKVSDAPGLVVGRTVAMLINEASDTVLEGIAARDGVDRAMKLATGYPAGPFEWLERWGVRGVVRLLDQVAELTRSERYRVSPELRQLAWRLELERSTKNAERRHVRAST
jgi:3-hydroxybutyryl-CoA dehydrogenase